MTNEVKVDADIPARISRKNVGMAEKAVFSPGVVRKETTDAPISPTPTSILNALRELSLFSILVIIATEISIASAPASRYYFHEVFAHFLTDSNFNTESGLFITFWDIHILDQIWDYFFKTFRPLMYSSLHDPIADTFMSNLKNKDKLLMVNGNILVVLPRIRQVRVRNDSCQVPDGFVYVFDSCYYYFNPQTEDKTPFGLKTGTLWTYQDETITKSTPITGEISTYSGGGYFMDFTLNQNETVKNLHEMWSNTWIDHGTRAVIIDVVAYTQRDNLFCVVTLLLEIPPSGGVVTSADVRVQQLLRYVTDEDFIILGFEAALLVCIVYFSIECVMLIVFTKLGSLKNPWTIYDIITFLIGYITVAIGLWRYFVVEEHLKGLRFAMETHQYFNFHTVSGVQETYELMIGIFALLVWIRLLKFAHMFRPCAVILRAFHIVRMEILALTLMLLLIVFGFAMFAHVTFGTHVKEFSTIGNSLFTLIALFSGGLYIYRRCEDVRPFVAPLFFVMYIFVVILLFLNWFAATIVHGMKRAMKEFDALSHHKQLYLKDVLWMFLMKMLLLCGFKKLHSRWEEEEKRSKTKGTYDLIVNLLKRNNFSVLERSLFLKRHDIVDENTPLSQSKVDNVVADIRGMNLRYIEVEEHMKVMDQIDKIKKRLEVLDNTLADMVVKVDVLIDKMKSAEEDVKVPA